MQLIVFTIFFPDDDELFKDLARTYAGNHEYMHKGSGICHSDSFPEGKLLRLWSFKLNKTQIVEFSAQKKSEDFTCIQKKFSYDFSFAE